MGDNSNKSQLQSDDIASDILFGDIIGRNIYAVHLLCSYGNQYDQLPMQAESDQ